MDVPRAAGAAPGAKTLGDSDSNEAQGGRVAWVGALRWWLLGSGRGRLARLGTGGTAIEWLAACTAVAHGLDLLSGLRLLLVFGSGEEQNPVARTVFEATGPLGLVFLKVAVVAAGVTLLRRLAARGRGRLARDALLATTWLGLLGFVSNLV
jgi:hypothetical protein